MTAVQPRVRVRIQVRVRVGVGLRVGVSVRVGVGARVRVPPGGRRASSDGSATRIWIEM